MAKVTTKDILNGLNLKQNDEFLIDNKVKCKVLNNKEILVVPIGHTIPVSSLIEREITKIEPTNEVIGNLVCSSITCNVCPLRWFECSGGENLTLYQKLEKLKEEHMPIEIYDVLKKNLNKSI